MASGTSAMETDNPSTSGGNTGNVGPPAPKRMKVDANDPTRELEDQRRGKIELDKAQRDLVLRWILACHINLTSVLTKANTVEDKAFRNIHFSEQITSIFSTIHNCLRQESLSSGTLRTTMEDKKYSVQLGGVPLVEFEHKSLMARVEEIAKSFGLIYKKPSKDDSNHWYGTAAPMMSFMNMFKVRINELRVGHGSFVIQKDALCVKRTSSSCYGFFSVHHPLIEGVTIPPEKKSGMAQSLGPLTSLICLARSDDDQKYSRRWKAAVKRDLAFLPEIDSIIEACCGKRASEVKDLYTLIADIILITTSREAKRVSFPACMMYHLLNENERKHYIANKTICTSPTDISWFNFSGNGAAFLYKTVMSKEWTCPIRDTGVMFLPEIVFYGIWGTFGTDFGLLEYMTGYIGWATRDKMGDCFKSMGTSSEESFRMMPLIKFSKMSSANQTGLLSLSSNPIVGKSAFSGVHKQIFTDEFIKYLVSVKGSSGGLTKNIETLKNLMSQTKEGLINLITENRVQTRGTTKWHSMEDCTSTTYGRELDEVPMVKGMLFMRGKE